MVHLILLSGNPVQTFPLSQSDQTYLIGRDSMCDLVLDDDLVSRTHAKVSLVGTRWQIEDCGSRNRIKVNQHAVQCEPLINGDLIRLGDSVLLFADSSRPAKRKKPNAIERETTTTSRLDMEPHFHPQVGNVVQEFATRHPVRSGLLGKLATLLHIVSTREQLFKIVVKTLREGIELQKVMIWLRNTRGRLELASHYPSRSKNSDPSLRASLAIENGQGMVFSQSDLDSSASSPGAICAIVPGPESIRGVIECVENASQKLTVQDLGFLVAVCGIVGPALNRIERIEALENSNVKLSSETNSIRMIGQSRSIENLKKRIGQVAKTDTTILVSGETGTGKELVAGLIHELSRRSKAPMVTVNCAAFSEGILESELFGHERGAFTGADKRRLGAFERANGGTLFLDEIGEMSLACQAKVLRVLEHYPFERVGGSELVNIDVRIVAATHRSLSEQVQAGEFRADLMYRLKVIELEVPALRERHNDVLILANHFVSHYCQQFGQPVPNFSESAKEMLLNYHWPGNIRELRNMMERVAVFNNGEPVTLQNISWESSPNPSFPTTEFQTIQELELRYIRHVMESVDGNKTEACRILGISRATLYKKLSLYEDPSLREPVGENVK